MRLTKKTLLSASLAFVMTAMSVAVPVVATAADPATDEGNVNTAYHLAENIGEGNILHAFNWYFNDVKKYMKDIAAAGFSSVQVSPVQGNKNTINVGAYALDWWATYQPINFEIGNNYGTREEFKAMCDEAEKYGVKIIVDIVANHMAQDNEGTAGGLHPDIIADLRDDPDCWHTSTTNISDTNRYSMTQNLLNGIPDLNTSNVKVQNYVKSLLKDCIDCGADGFRFDAAKHIELDTDPDINGVHYASDFWKNVTSYARELKPDVFIYGEVLNPFGTDVSNYTKYMSITDSKYGEKVRNAAKGTNTPGLANLTFPNEDPSHFVLWYESHDTYTARQSTALGGRQNDLEHTKLLMGWGMIGARKDSPSLYLVRPAHEKTENSSGGIIYDELMGGPGQLLWQDPTIVAINELKNSHVGESENAFSVDELTKVFFVQRGDDSMVITNYNTKDAELNVQTTMKDGVYKDVVSDREYTVTNGVLTGSIPTKTVVVLNARTNAVPTATITLGDRVIKPSDSDLSFTGENLQFRLNCSEDVTDGEISCYNAATSELLATEDFIGGMEYLDVSLESAVEVGESVKIVVKYQNDNGDVEDIYTIMRKDPDANCVAYLDMSYLKDWDAQDAPGVYCYAKNADGEQLADYPGYQMQRVIGTTYVKCELPEKAGFVKFNEGPVESGLDGRTIPPTVADYGSAIYPEHREAGGLEITGSMLWSKGTWSNYTEEHSAECTPYSYGDVNGDGVVNLADAILTQKQSLNISTLSDKGIYSADIDGDFEVSLNDAVTIQKDCLTRQNQFI